MLMQTHMRREIFEISDAVENLLAKGQSQTIAAAQALRAQDPTFFISVARGSSDHAATYFKYVCEMVAGVPVASVGPSIASIYECPLNLKGSACVTISQSGKSPDIVRMAQMSREQGALSIALSNQPQSDLANVSDHTLELHAGDEISVAATKTFVTSTVAGLCLLARWQQNEELLKAIHRLPAYLAQAAAVDWSELADQISDTSSLFCLGRGPSYAISNEAALKFKETCQLHAESYSSAEVLHGPVSIVETGFPVLSFCAADQAEESVAQVSDSIAQMGGKVFACTDKVKSAQQLNCIRTGHPLTDPISLIVSFYAMVEQISRARGGNPDQPRNLRKVTQTV